MKAWPSYRRGMGFYVRGQAVISPWFTLLIRRSQPPPARSVLETVSYPWLVSL